MKTSLRLFLLTAFSALALLTNTTSGVAMSFQASGTAPQTTGGKKAAPKAVPSSEEIADARAKGLVWVNLSTHVYHKTDSSLYGATKRGRFMTEDEAKKAGFRAANEAGVSKKKAAAATPAQR